jgi:O-antigen ligase
VVNTATFDVPPMLMLALPPLVPMLASDVPLNILLGVRPVSAAPLPIKYAAAMLAVVVILAADTNALTTLPLRLNPEAFKLPPVMLPLAETDAADTAAAVIKFPPVTLPVAVINPAVLMLPPVTLAVAETIDPSKLPTTKLP